MIPRILHIIWIGDEEKQPDKWIDTWRLHHPNWIIQLWSNLYYEHLTWLCTKQMEICWKAKRFEGVADIMRYEILFKYGGVYVDADSECLKPLDTLLDTEFFACYESETHIPGQIANGFIGCIPEHPIMGELIKRISEMKNPLRQNGKRVRPWQSLGPKLFTEVINGYKGNVTILPSKTFIPTHFLDLHTHDTEGSYAVHHWGTTKGLY